VGLISGGKDGRNGLPQPRIRLSIANGCGFFAAAMEPGLDARHGHDLGPVAAGSAGAPPWVLVAYGWQREKASVEVRHATALGISLAHDPVVQQGYRPYGAANAMRH
jgi:hypothetical protein